MSGERLHDSRESIVQNWWRSGEVIYWSKLRTLKQGAQIRWGGLGREYSELWGISMFALISGLQLNHHRPPLVVVLVPSGKCKT